jgi:hypothetical protein
LYGLPLVTMGAVSATIVAGGQVRIILNIEVDRNKLITTLILWIYLNPLIATSDNICARPPAPRVAWNHQRCWRGERLHHHGGAVCWLFVLLWIDLWRHELIICKKWYKNNLKMRLIALLFDLRRRALHQLWLLKSAIEMQNISAFQQYELLFYTEKQASTLPNVTREISPLWYMS